MLLAFERAERTDDPTERMANLTFVVVGGGPTGVETAGAIAEIAFKTLTREFRSIDPSVGEGRPPRRRTSGCSAPTPNSSPTRPNASSATSVSTFGSVSPSPTSTNGPSTTTAGPIAARTAVWAAGNAASPLAAMLGGPTDRAGRVFVEPDLSVAGHPTVFAVGDVAHAVSHGGDVPGVAQGAIQGGRHAANAIRPTSPVGPGRRSSTGTRANSPRSAGRRRSARSCSAGRGVQLSGWIAWMAWWSIHVAFLIDFRSRLSVLLSWAWNYVTFQRGARLITGPWRPGIGHVPDGEDIGT